MVKVLEITNSGRGGTGIKSENLGWEGGLGIFQKLTIGGTGTIIRYYRVENKIKYGKFYFFSF